MRPRSTTSSFTRDSTPPVPSRRIRLAIETFDFGRYGRAVPGVPQCSSTPRASGCSGIRRSPRRPKTLLSIRRPSSCSGPRTNRLCCRLPATACGPPWCARAWSTAGRAGLSPTCSATPSAGMIRIIGTGENRWPTVYDRDWPTSESDPGPARRRIWRLPRERRERRTRQRDCRGDCRARSSRPPMCGACRSKEAQAKLGPYALALALDQVVRSPRAHALGWAPELKSVATNAARLFDEWRADSAGRERVARASG